MRWCNAPWCADSIDLVYCKSETQVIWTPDIGQIKIRKQTWHPGPFLVSLFPCLCAGSLSLIFSTWFSIQSIIAAIPVAKASSPSRSCSWQFPASFLPLLNASLFGSVCKTCLHRGACSLTALFLSLWSCIALPVCSRRSLCDAEC